VPTACAAGAGPDPGNRSTHPNSTTTHFEAEAVWLVRAQVGAHCCAPPPGDVRRRDEYPIVGRVQIATPHAQLTLATGHCSLVTSADTP
jgi:hypothetical protein